MRPAERRHVNRSVDSERRGWSRTATPACQHGETFAMRRVNICQNKRRTEFSNQSTHCSETRTWHNATTRFLVQEEQMTLSTGHHWELVELLPLFPLFENAKTQSSCLTPALEKEQVLDKTDCSNCPKQRPAPRVDDKRPVVLIFLTSFQQAVAARWRALQS